MNFHFFTKFWTYFTIFPTFLLKKFNNLKKCSGHTNTILRPGRNRQREKKKGLDQEIIILICCCTFMQKIVYVLEETTVQKTANNALWGEILHKTLWKSQNIL